MNFFRLVSTTVIPAAILTFVVVACSSGTTTTGSSSGTSGTSGGTSGTSGGTSGTSGGTSGSSGSGFKDCSTSKSACTPAEIKPYSDCLDTKCGAELKTAFGPDYKSGTFGGACAEFITCTQKCACDDTKCSTACFPDGGFPKACTDALTAYGTCTKQCTAPACTKADGG